MKGMCPNCDSDVPLANTVKRKDAVDCPVCGEPLIVVSLHPVELDYDMDNYDFDEDDEYEDD